MSVPSIAQRVAELLAAAPPITPEQAAKSATILTRVAPNPEQELAHSGDHDVVRGGEAA